MNKKNAKLVGAVALFPILIPIQFVGEFYTNFSRSSSSVRGALRHAKKDVVYDLKMAPAEVKRQWKKNKEDDQ